MVKNFSVSQSELVSQSRPVTVCQSESESESEAEAVSHSES